VRSIDFHSSLIHCPGIFRAHSLHFLVYKPLTYLKKYVIITLGISTGIPKRTIWFEYLRIRINTLNIERVAPPHPPSPHRGEDEGEGENTPSAWRRHPSERGECSFSPRGRRWKMRGKNTKSSLSHRKGLKKGRGIKQPPNIER